jgi:hypothetical protein
VELEINLALQELPGFANLGPYPMTQCQHFKL